MVFLQNEQNRQNESSSLLHRIEEVICQNGLLEPGDRLIVGVSGGADSLALLHLLHSLDLSLQLVAVYINHNLRPEEVKEEEQTVRNICRELQIPFIYESVNVREYGAGRKYSLEEAARTLRHESLERIRREQDASLIALAHTADDQVEEFFIRLLRGTSLKGLSGMRVKRDNIIRPLLNESKDSLINYLTQKTISYCHDSSNFTREFLRNRVRLDLLPELEKEFNPSIRQTILQNMDILAHDEDFLAEVSRDAFNHCVTADSGIDTHKSTDRLVLLPEPLASLHHAIQCRVVEKCFWLMKIKPGYLQIKSLLQFTLTAENNSELHLADGVRVTRMKNQIVFSRPLKKGRKRGSAAADTFRPLKISSPGDYAIKGLGKILKLYILTGGTEDKLDKEILFLDLDTITFPLLLRPPEEGERFKPYNSAGRKKIMRYLGEQKIEGKNRAGYPVLLSDSKVIALPGLEISHEVRITEITKTVLAVELIDLFPLVGG